MSKYTDVYYYEFGYRGSLGEFENSFAGVGHYEEIFYIFANKPNANAADKLTRTRLLELWSNFIKFGNPTPTALEGVTWESNSPKNRQRDAVKYLSLNNSLTMRTNPDQVDWEFYQRLYDKYGDPPFSTY